jgi:4-amino-4-deoxy-L-arabinose transferase-like glycosyltransferase
MPPWPCSVAMIDGGITRLWRPYAVMAGSDYIGAVPKITTPAAFLAQYVELLPKLPLHCRTHPPGGPLFLWGVEQAWGAGPAPAALATILGGTLAIPAVWGLARLVLDRRRALWATALFVWSPCIVLFTATCMDIVFSVPMIWTFYLMWRGRQSQPIRCGVAAGVSASLAAMFTFSAGFLAIWAVVAFFLTTLFDRPRLRNTLIAWCAAAATAIVFYTTLYALTGYHLLETLAACTQSHFQIMDGGNHAAWRQYGHLVFANLVAFFFSVGVPLAVLWIRRTAADLQDMLPAKHKTRDSGRLLGVSFLAALLILDLAPVHTLEVEHIWLYMVPLVVIGAVRGLTTKNAADDRRVVLAALGLLMLQTIAMEVLLTTLW